MQLNEEQRKLVEDNHNLIYGLIKSRGLDLDEYYDICAIALCKAALAFDPARGNTFSTLAYRTMSNEVKSYWRYNSSPARKPEMANISMSDIVFGTIPDRGKLSIEGCIQGHGDSGISPHGVVYVSMFVNSLPVREQKVLQMRMDGLTVKEIGDELGRTHQWASLMLKKVRNKYIAEMAV